jgi:dipeptidyl aminopeptidase/acylaminoacyl peptidase
MYMAGYEDEDEFDRFMTTLSLRGTGEQVKCPYLVVAGEDDELSPIEYTYELLEAIKTPKELLLYQGETHGLNTTTSSALGPHWHTYMAEWIKDRLDGRPMESKNILVDLAGQTHAIEIPRRVDR